MKKKKLKFILYPLIATTVIATISLISIGQAGWQSVVIDTNWSSGDKYLYNIKLDYLEGEDVTFVGLERSSKVNLPKFGDDRYDSAWKIGENSYSGVVSVDRLFTDSGSPAPVTSGKTKVYTLTLTEERLDLKDGYVEIVVDHAYNMSDSGAEIAAFETYSLITKIAERFLVFNLNPQVSGYMLDHFVYEDTTPVTYGLNDILYLSSGGADESKISNKQLVLSAYFKAE